MVEGSSEARKKRHVQVVVSVVCARGRDRRETSDVDAWVRAVF